MAEEKEVVASEEEEKIVLPEEEEKKSSEEEEFVKEGDVVAVGKHNQAIRKLREAELEKRELEKQLAEVKNVKPIEEKEEEDFFKEEEKPVDHEKLIEEKLKPINDALAKREANDRKIQRTAFFEAHPDYLTNSEKWQNILDEVDNFNPNSTDDYYTQLEKAHRIIVGNADDSVIEDKKKEIANDVSSGGGGAEKVSVKEEFTAEERKYQKEFNVSDEGMRAYKKGISSGTIRIL